MTQTNKKLIAAALIVVSAFTNIVSYFFLPDKLIMQITVDGSAGTTLPTLWGLLIAFVLFLYCVYRFYAAEDKKEKNKFLIGSIIIFAVNIFTIVYNLMR